jgi:hypothetical protein
VGAGEAEAYTDSTGRFHVDKLGGGTYALIVRRVGYLPLARDIVVGEAGLSIDVLLSPAPAALPTVVTAAARGGLSGVVVDTAQNLLVNVGVSVLGANRQANTDSTGSFYTPLRSGRYMVRLSHPGFATRLVSVTVPRDSGRRIFVGLAPATRAMSVRQANALWDLRRRLIFSTGPNHVFTHEDMASLGFTEIDRFARISVVHPVDPACMAILDGDPSEQQPIWTLHASDLEMLEVYSSEPTMSISRDVHRAHEAPGSQRPGRCPTIIAWLRK